MSDMPMGPGARIRAARVQQGVPLDVLAAQLKVPVARLDALEAERWEDLPDATHARALATSLCRALGLDPRPVLAAMPRGEGAALERVTQGLNQPVRTHAGARVPVWMVASVAVLLLVGAAMVAWPDLRDRLPSWEWIGAGAPTDSGVETVPLVLGAPSGASAAELGASASASSPASAASSTSAPDATTVIAAPSAANATNATNAASANDPGTSAAAGASAAAVLPPALSLDIRASRGPSWISVTDANGVTLAAQLLDLGESLRLPIPTALPVRVVLGNAPVLDVTWRGQSQPLEGYEQRRVARLELK